MATFPPTVAPQGAPSSGGAGSPAIKLAMLSQAIQGLAKDFPQGQQGIEMMMKGLRMLQGITAAQSSQAQPSAPPA